MLLPAANAASAGFDWSGYYAGGQIGLGLVDGSYFLDTNDILLDRTYQLSANALRFGILGGYNYIADGVLVGVEADASFGNSGDSFSVINDFSIDSEATLRLRFGLPHDRLLPYVTLGAALAGAKSDDVFLGSDTGLHLGLAAGAGLEFALTDTVALRGEYLFESLGKTTYEFSDAFNNFNDTAAWDEHILRAAVIWRFGTPF